MSERPRKRKRAKGVDQSRYGYLFIAPFFLVYFVFQGYPLLNTIYLAFQRYMITGANKTIGPEFYGLANFRNVLLKGSTIQVFMNTAIMWIINFIPQILLALLLAKWLTDRRLKIRGQAALKIMIYMPNIITAASISMLFYSIFAFPQGPANSALAQLGLIDKATYLNAGSAATVAYRFLEKGWSVRLIIAFINFWMWYGNTMIILIAGIHGINLNLFEAAEVDGASPNQIFMKITLPLLKPIILYTLISSLIGGLQMYDIPQMMQQQGTPAKAMTQTVTMYIMELVYAGTKDYGRGAAVSVLLFLVTGAVSLVLFFIMKDRDAKPAKARKGASV